MSNFSIEPFFDPVKQWQYYISNDVALRMPYDINDPLFLQKVSVLQAEQVKNMVSSSYSQIAAFRDETDNNFEANRQAMEKGMSVLDSRITQVGGMITNSLESGFAAMNYGFTDLSNKAEIANAYLSDINKGMALSNQYSQQLVQSTGQLNAGVAQVNRSLVGINNNLIAIEKTLSNGFALLSARLWAISKTLDSILEELKIPETQRERRYHIQEGMKYLAQATKDNDDLYFEDALDEFNKAISIESKDFFSHYYLGYIYMYSKEHFDIDKAIDHFRRFIHYAKAVLDTALAKSLWDDGCFYLSIGYYLKGKLPEAIEIITMQTGDSEKVLLQQAKYLSLGNDDEQRQSMQVVTKILDKNPYAIMLIMQDRDVLMNPYLIEHINGLRDNAYKKAKEAFIIVKEAKESTGATAIEDKGLLDSFIRQNTYLSAVAAQGYYREKGSLWIHLKMVKVEGGTFWMGAQFQYSKGSNFDRAARYEEGPVHRVTLSDFYISESLVTQALWQKVMGNNPSHRGWQGNNLPVENVSWQDCQEFIRKLNIMTGRIFRLPTEAEWEYAARGGRKSRGYKYSGSNIIDDVAWPVFENGPQPVKTKLPNELGLYDMTGRVRQWCHDYYGRYSSDSQINPTGPDNGKYDVSNVYHHVLRGEGYTGDYRVSARISSGLFSSNVLCGLRLAHS